MKALRVPDVPATWITALWGALVVSIPFQRVWTLPVVGDKLQPPEVVAALLIVLAAWQLAAGSVPVRCTWTDAAALGWWTAVTVATLAAVARAASTVLGPCLEWTGTTFLVLLNAALRVTATTERLRRVPRLFTWMGLVASCTALAGFVLALAGYDTALARTTLLPYFGYVPRATGFAPAPAMVASLVITGLFGWAALRSLRPKAADASPVAFGLLLASFVTTQAKVVMALACGSIAAWLARSRPTRVFWIPVTLLALLATMYIAVSHLVLLRASDRQALAATRYIAESPIASFVWGEQEWLLVPSNYWFNKRASLIAVCQTWPAGLGPGGHNRFVAELMRTGRHPPNLWAADPHSTYLGAAAELGLAGAFGLVGFGMALVADLRRITRHQAWWAQRVAPMLAGAVTSVALEAVTTDVMNFRHYWVAAATLASLASLCPGRGRGARLP